MGAMNFFQSLFVLSAVSALAGCSFFQPAPVLPENTPRLISFQLGVEPELLVIPIRDVGDSLAIATPRVMRSPYREILQLNRGCGSVWMGKWTPSRLLMLTTSGNLWSVLPLETPEVRLAFFRATLDETEKRRLLDELKTRTFERLDPGSIWLSPGTTGRTPSTVSIELLERDANWDAALRFLEKVEAPGAFKPFEPFDRAFGRHGVYCSAKDSHVKPDYPPNAILTLEYAKEQPLRINGNAEFSKKEELDQALSLHLASGSYALVKLKLSSMEDVFPLEHSGIGALVYKRALYYGADHVVELPDRTTIWYCSRCFSPE